ncbi:uncharacterized protein LOC110351108 isoform X2 [Heterocephalus glaber]|uniref:Uncharacterized protein LOC110351108 isoform X2 n=1 Tax=Heterocephalus glaber TaxID=10181 RepID=A0AAX6TMH2_HETGA|nr:uncharacterized protein LOC110351108 isoform X2 [Heterocephalus glaber]
MDVCLWVYIHTCCCVCLCVCVPGCSCLCLCSLYMFVSQSVCLCISMCICVGACMLQVLVVGVWHPSAELGGGSADKRLSLELQPWPLTVLFLSFLVPLTHSCSTGTRAPPSLPGRLPASPRFPTFPSTSAVPDHTSPPSRSISFLSFLVSLTIFQVWNHPSILLSTIMKSTIVTLTTLQQKVPRGGLGTARDKTGGRPREGPARLPTAPVTDLTIYNSCSPNRRLEGLSEGISLRGQGLQGSHSFSELLTEHVVCAGSLGCSPGLHSQPVRMPAPDGEETAEGTDMGEAFVTTPCPAALLYPLGSGYRFLRKNTPQPP